MTHKQIRLKPKAKLHPLNLVWTKLLPSRVMEDVLNKSIWNTRYSHSLHTEGISYYCLNTQHSKQSICWFAISCSSQLSKHFKQGCKYLLVQEPCKVYTTINRSRLMLPTQGTLPWPLWARSRRCQVTCRSKLLFFHNSALSRQHKAGTYSVLEWLLWSLQIYKHLPTHILAGATRIQKETFHS